MIKPDYIILHHTLTSDGKIVDTQAIRRYHLSWAYKGRIIKEKDAKALIAEGKIVKHPWKDIGYHFVCELVNGAYEIIGGRVIGQTGAHTKGMNTRSLGIAMVGNFDMAAPCKNQWWATVKYVAGLVDYLNIPVSHIKGHRDYASYKSCPGEKFDLDRFRADVMRFEITKYT